MDLLFHYKLKSGSRPILYINFRYFLLPMNSSSSTITQKKVYDEITYEKRVQLIQLIESGNWTIRGAAQLLDIKLCTAKYILYNYRRKGNIYGKKRGSHPKPQVSEEVGDRQQPAQVVYVPCPIYIFVFPSQDHFPCFWPDQPQI